MPAKSFELLKILARGQPREAHMVKTCNTHEAHLIIRVPAVNKTWGDMVRHGSLVVCQGQSTCLLSLTNGFFHVYSTI